MLRVAVAIVPEVRQLLREDPSQLSALMEEIHDEDLADLLGLLDENEAAQILRELKATEAAQIFERLDEDTQEALVEQLGVERMAPIVAEMAADDRTDLIEALPEQVGDDLVETLEKVDPEAAAEVEALAKWPEDSAGGLMTTDYIAVAPDMSVADVIERIRTDGAEAETVYYTYVVDDRHRLVGIASLRDLLLATPQTVKVSEVMTENVTSVAPDTDQEDVARTMAKYDFAALPVLGPHRKLLGVITFDDVMDVLTQEQTEDMQRLGAVEPTEEGYFQTTFWTFIRKRGLWLSVLFVSELITGNVMRHYEGVIHAVTALSVYVPLLISTGGNSGSQSASLIIRGLAVGEVKASDWRRVFVREVSQGLVLGFALAVMGMIRVWAWGDGTAIMFTIGVTLLVIVAAGCTVGAMLPLLLRRLGLDPATSSTPFIATLIDVLGILVYFNVAKLMLAEVLKAAAIPH